MLYTVKEHINPLQKNSPAKYHPAPVYIDTMSLDDLAELISHSTSLTPADVKAVILELVELLRKNLVRGVKVRIDGWGTFKLSFGGKGHENPEDVSSSDIDHVRVTYVADSKIKKFITANVVFEKQRQKKTTGEKTESNVD